MLKRDETENPPAKPQNYACCGATYEPQTQGRFRLAGTDTWLCTACFTVAIAERDRRDASSRSP